MYKCLFAGILWLWGTGFVGAQPEQYFNIWNTAPKHMPSQVSTDAPLMGNGDLTVSLGFKNNTLRYYLSKNDFWRLRSKADGLSGPRVVGFVDLKIDDFEQRDFSASQQLENGITSCLLQKGQRSIRFKSWVAATNNLVFIELTALKGTANCSIGLSAPENKRAVLNKGQSQDCLWLTRAFKDSVDIATEVGVALKAVTKGVFRAEPNFNAIRLEPGKKIIFVLAVESNFKKPNPLGFVLRRIRAINKAKIDKISLHHNNWWRQYWHKSSIHIADTVLMKAYYQGLYTMGACSRDNRFSPAIFGWVSTDQPAWNGDYHLNYNFQAPFYALYAANRVSQGKTQDAPLLDFMDRGALYARQVTHTRGILYPVGIGPLGIETTRDFPAYQNSDNAEKEGLFFGQKSNAVYGLVNMAEAWRTTYDTAYGKKIYPYALAVADFWEDYLKYENGRYVIYNDAIQEGSGKDMNPILSLGLVRNAFDLILDLSATLHIDIDRQAKWKDILAKISAFPLQIRNGKTVFRYTEKGVDWWPDNGLGIQHIFPASAITLDSPEDLLIAAKNTIDEMQRWEDMNTSNSFFMAAIRTGYDFMRTLKELHKYALHTYPNGFQLNNPHGIENSCTVAGALDEMFCMSVGNVIRLFVGWPKSQPASFKNIRSWGAFLVSASLKNEVVGHVNIFSERGRDCTLVNPWPDKKVRLTRNGRRSEVIFGKRLHFKTAVNERIGVRPVEGSK